MIEKGSSAAIIHFYDRVYIPRFHFEKSITCVFAPTPVVQQLANDVTYIRGQISF